MTALTENDPLPALYDGLGRKAQEITVDVNFDLASNDLYYSTAGQVLDERLNVTSEGSGDGGILNAQNVWGQVYVNALVQRTVIAYWEVVGDVPTPFYTSYNVTQDANFDTTGVFQSGTVQYRMNYTAYGDVTFYYAVAGDTVLTTSNGLNLTYLWQDMRFDAPINSYSTATRFYNVPLMRWITADAGYFDGLNLYQLERGNPINKLDPRGTWSLIRWLYTDDGNASDEEYNAAAEGGGEAYIDHARVTHEGLQLLGNVPGAGKVATATDQVLTKLEGDDLHNQIMKDTRLTAVTPKANGPMAKHPDGPPCPAKGGLANQAGLGAMAGINVGVNDGITQANVGGNTPAAINGNDFHYDQLNGGEGVGGPTLLQEKYPDTTFDFAKRGEEGPDVTHIDGPHPSEYPGSDWDPDNKFGDFKPNTPSGEQTYWQDINSEKLPADTEPIYYDPDTWTLDD